MYKKIFVVVVALLFLFLTPALADPVPVTFSASSGDLSASVTFEFDGTSLVVTLINTSAADVLVPVDVLTGVFFDVDGAVPYRISKAFREPQKDLIERSFQIRAPQNTLLR